MDGTRKLWASVAVVGVIVVAGASVAAAASAGMLERAGEETRAVVERAPGDPAPEPESTDDDVVVSEEVNPDPGEVLHYWTDERMEGAEPMPMPEVTTGEIIVTE
jgi:hypothetical protein